jgi:hypothetical protein
MRASALAAVALCVAVDVAAQTRDERAAPVGMRARIEQLVLPGTELAAAPSTFASPVIVHVVAVWPHGTLRRYDLEWVGYEPGRHDLARFLVRKDGSSTDDLPTIPVEVTGSLPARGLVEPSELPPRAPERLDGYRALQIVAGVVWVVGLLAILLVGRRFRRHKAAVVAVPTLADRLRPLVQAVVDGSADTNAKAELERLLVAFWRQRLGLGDATAAAAIVAIKAHPEAGALLRQVEAWLHMPQPPETLDLHAALAPYRSVAARDLAPLPAAAAEGR